jgi:hypothetical protein
MGMLFIAFQGFAIVPALAGDVATRRGRCRAPA